jgi:hypothetical protein
MAFVENLVEKIKKIIFNPNEFFESIKLEAGIMEAFKFFVIVALVYLVFTLILSFISISILFSGLFGVGSFSGLLPGIAGIGFPIFSYIAQLVAIFVEAAIIYFFAMLFGGKGDYSATYKALAYAATPFLLAGWIPFLGIIAALYSFYLAIVGISKLHQVSMGRAFVILIIPVVIFIALSFAFAQIFVSQFLGTVKPEEKLPSGLSEFKLISIESSSCLPEGDGNIVIKNVGLSTINSKEISVVKDDVPLTYGQFQVDKTEITPGATATIKVPCTTPGSKKVCRYLINGMFYEVSCGY